MRFGGDISGFAAICRPTNRPVSRWHELITPQIDHFDESRFWRDVTPQFRMAQRVGPCRTPHDVARALTTTPYDMTSIHVLALSAGLPGLICALSGSSAESRRVFGKDPEPLYITGPPGICDYIKVGPGVICVFFCPVLNSSNSAHYARIMPSHTQLCRLVSQRRAGEMPETG
jgi:hypothetical protein